METNILTVMEMAERGQQKLNDQAAEAKRQEDLEISANRDAWQKLLASIRQAFPAPIQAFVWLPAAKEEAPCEGPDMDAYKRDVYIEVEGFAPITCEVRRDKDGAWSLHQDNYGKRYQVPHAYDDYEFGISWSWHSYRDRTNDLEEALAYAQKRGEERRELEQRKRQAQVVEPVYEEETVDRDIEPTFMDSLVTLIRDVAREEIQKAIG